RHQTALARAMSITTPASRMVYVEGIYYPPNANAKPNPHRFYPVLAIKATNKILYWATTQDADPPRMGATHEEMLGFGWSVEDASDFVEYTPVLFDGDRLCDPESVEAMSTVGRLVLAPWPPEEDEERLAPVVSELTNRARRQFRFFSKLPNEAQRKLRSKKELWEAIERDEADPQP